MILLSMSLGVKKGQWVVYWLSPGFGYMMPDVWMFLDIYRVGIGWKNSWLIIVNFSLFIWLCLISYKQILCNSHIMSYSTHFMQENTISTLQQNKIKKGLKISY